MNLDRNTFAVVLDRNFASLSVDCNTDFAHILVVLLVVCRVDQNLVEDLVQTGYVGNVSELHALVG